MPYVHRSLLNHIEKCSQSIWTLPKVNRHFHTQETIRSTPAIRSSHSEIEAKWKVPLLLWQTQRKGIHGCAGPEIPGALSLSLLRYLWCVYLLPDSAQDPHIPHYVLFLSSAATALSYWLTPRWNLHLSNDSFLAPLSGYKSHAGGWPGAQNSQTGSLPSWGHRYKPCLWHGSLLHSSPKKLSWQGKGRDLFLCDPRSGTISLLCEWGGGGLSKSQEPRNLV